MNNLPPGVTNRMIEEQVESGGMVIAAVHHELSLASLTPRPVQLAAA